ncbi:hypothetical protein BJ508DRAFT_111961 [Ascobolus immersus RN42]|uniref:Uncharacterized protein n=1 Tax=Ascobolus immersus RN42 TaxID=1160509 RepID=A0A3N4H882_ASCIM|nr:hypothetical protein BJ508DRAFT_111961 [Ascobolus immersus RN42]
MKNPSSSSTASSSRNLMVWITSGQSKEQVETAPSTESRESWKAKPANSSAPKPPPPAPQPPPLPLPLPHHQIPPLTQTLLQMQSQSSRLLPWGKLRRLLTIGWGTRRRGL